MTVGGPLCGVRVLDFSQIVAGPFAGANLCDLGAEVIKVEPPGGDPFRTLGTATPAGSKQFQSLNRGKRSIVLNLKDARGRALVHRLVAGVDVVIVNYRPEAARRLGVDYETLRALRHDLIYVQSTGFGVRGPRKAQSGSDLVVSAYSGLLAHEGKLNEAGEPGIISIAYTDYATGLAIAMAICAALYHRQRTGEGQIIHTSLLQSALTLEHGFVMREPVTDAVTRDPMVARLGELRACGASFPELLAGYMERRFAFSAFRLYWTGYQAKDGALVLGALTRANREAIRAVLGITDDITDSPDFNAADPAAPAIIASVQDEIRRILRTRTVAEWVEAFDAAGAPVSAINFAEEVADDPQVEALGIMVEVEHELTGRQRLVGPVIEMSATPPAVQGAAPLAGSHTDAILAELGYTPAEIDALCAAGVAARPFS